MEKKKGIPGKSAATLHHGVAEEGRHGRENILNAVSSAAEQFLKDNPPEDKRIPDILTRLGRATGVSRIAIFENHRFDDGELYCSQRHEWAAPGIDPQINNPEVKNSSWERGARSRWKDILQTGGAIKGLVRELPPEEQALLERQSVQSVLVVPIIVDNEWWGFIGFDECRRERNWSESETDALKTASAMLGVLIRRRRIENMLKIQSDLGFALSSTSDLKDAMDRLLEGVVQIEGIDCGAAYLMDERSETLKLIALHSLSQAFEEKIGSIDAGTPLALRIGKGKPVFSLFKDLRPETALAEEGLRASALLPVLYKGNVMAVLEVASRTYDELPDYTKPVLESISAHVGGVLARIKAENANRLERDKAQKYLDVAQVMLIEINSDERVGLINQKGCDVLGYTQGEIVGRNWFDLCIPENQRDGIRGLFRRLLEGKVTPGESYEYAVITKSGAQRIIAWHNKVLYNEQGGIIATLSSGEDITDRKRAEEQIKASLQEKEVLLTEIHHRVKNNLQIISSLLELASRRSGKPDVVDALSEARLKIHVMAQIHSQLYQNENFDQIHMESNIRDLVNNFSLIYGRAKKVTPIIRAEEIHLPVTQAIPCALVLCELISNAYKHAFAEGQEGTLEIAMADLEENSVVMKLRDDGAGIPESVDPFETSTLGLKLVRNLVMKQLRGKLDIHRERGTELQITFERTREEAL
ncbi:MAG: histidine kinase dimerization/phosphoacceptor domain -containing protein [Planctomycetota bacterium]|jgi:PAS domain S-box-containing protein